MKKIDKKIEAQQELASIIEDYFFHETDPNEPGLTRAISLAEKILENLDVSLKPRKSQEKA